MIWLRRLGSLALTLAAIAGVLGAALFVAVQTGAVQTLVVVSGSMSPTIYEGDALISRPVAAPDLQVGDIVTVHHDDDTLVTHRIVDIEDADPSETADSAARALQLQGDANDGPDPVTYTVTEAWVPSVRIPGGGAVVETLRRPAVLIPAGVAAVALVAMAFVPSARREDEGKADDTSPAPDTAPESVADTTDTELEQV